MNRLNPFTIAMGSIVLAASTLLFMRPTRGMNRMMGRTRGRSMVRRIRKRLQIA